MSSLFGSKNKYRTSPEMQETIRFLLQQMPRQQYNNPFLQQGQTYTNQVLDPNYRAYSQEDIQRMYNAQAENLQRDVFKPEEDKLAARLALRGLSNSRVGSGRWEDQSKSNKQILSNLYNSLQDQNLALTAQQRAQAYSMLPSFSNMYENNQVSYLNPWFMYASLLGSEANRQLQRQQMANQNKGLLGSALGAAAGFFF